MLKLTIKNLTAHKRRLVAMSLAVILGVAFLSATLTLGDTMRAGFKSAIAEGIGDTSVAVRSATRLSGGDSGAQAGVVDAGLVDQLRNVDGVAQAEPSVEGVAQLIGADGRPLGGEGPPTIGANWVPTGPLNAFHIVDGRAPEAAGEVVIDRRSAREGDLHVGEQTIVRTPQPQQVTIVGIAGFGEYETLGGATMTFFTTDQASQLLLGAPGKLSSVSLAAEPGVSQAELAARVSPTLPAGTEAVTGATLRAEFEQSIEDDFLGFFRALLLAFAMVALLVATFSIYNTFSIVVAQRTRESALLRALGASRRQVLRSVVIEAFLIGAIASGIGLAAGYGLAAGMKALLGAQDLDLPVGLVLTAGTITAALVVGVGVTLVASIAPAIKASRVAPLAAMRDVAVDRSATSKVRALAGLVTTGGGIALLIVGATGGTFALVGIGTLVALTGFVLLGPVVARPAAAILGAPVAILRGRAGSLARRNAMRNPKRTAATASALMIGVAVVAAFTVLAASVKASVAHTADTAVKADLVLAQNDGSVPGIDPATAPALRELPQLDKVVAAGVGTMRINGATEEPMVMDTTDLTALVDMQVQQGSLDHLPADGLALQADFAKEHGLALGSQVPVTFPDGTQSTMTVDVVYGLKNLFGDILVSQDAYVPHATQPADVVILMTTAPGVSTTDAQAAAQSVAERFYTPDVKTRSAYMDSVNAQVDQALAFVYGLLAIAVIIAVMGIGNTISLSVHERTRELGLLRAIGQSRRRIRTMVRGEAIVVAIFGTVGGLLLGTLGGWAVVQAIGDDQGIGSFDLPVDRLLVVVALGALAGVLAARRPAKRAAKLDILGAIVTG